MVFIKIVLEMHFYMKSTKFGRIGASFILSFVPKIREFFHFTDDPFSTLCLFLCLDFLTWTNKVAIHIAYPLFVIKLSHKLYFIVFYCRSYWENPIACLKKYLIIENNSKDLESHVKFLFLLIFWFQVQNLTNLQSNCGHLEVDNFFLDF